MSKGGTSLYERDQQALSKMSFLRFFPLAVTGGDGVWLIVRNEDYKPCS